MASSSVPVSARSLGWMSRSRFRLLVYLSSIWLNIMVGVSYLPPTGLSLENGLARTPPMGWMSWLRFRCQIDCNNFPDECISENLFTRTTDLLVSEGYAAAGYQYVIVDDCWLAKERDARGRLMPDPERFPRGIKYLADYIHNKGLKFGLYENYGEVTCEGYPGVMNNLAVDALSFAKWDVDYVKLDGCKVNISKLDEGYTLFGSYLRRTGRPMVYSCSWPYYFLENHKEPNMSKVSKHCNLWRNFYDINEWYNVRHTIEWYAENQDNLTRHAGPGHWNDPDMLIIGNKGITINQSKLQMAIWAILAAPLIMSNDLRYILPEIKAILQNKEIIAINQDPSGIQGKRVLVGKVITVWLRPLTPLGKSYAIAICNALEEMASHGFTLQLKTLGLINHDGYKLLDLYENKVYFVTPNDTIRGQVGPSGVIFYKATARFL